MNATTVARVIEARDIHLAACRHRAQGLVCSTCSDRSERAECIAARVVVVVAEAA
jgi:hypothetical protein